MILHLPVILACLSAIAGLNGSFQSLKKQEEEPCARTSDVVVVQETLPKAIPAPNTAAIRAVPGQITAALSEASWNGIVLLTVTVLLTLGLALIVLFIDLPPAAMASLGIVALGGAVLSAASLSRRYSAHAWLPAHGPTGENGSATATAARGSLPIPPVARAQAERPQPAPIPEAAPLAALEQYWVAEPYSYVRIERRGDMGFTYVVVEPAISTKERTILMETYAVLRDTIIYDNTEKGRDNLIDPAVAAKIIRQFDPDISGDRVAILNYYIRRDLAGYGPLEVMMRDPALEDLSCNGYNLPVFVFHRVYGSLPSSITFTEPELNQFVLKLAQKANKQMSLSNPMVDATLPDGARIQITYSEVVSTKGSSFTIRKFRAEPMTPLDLIRLGTYDIRTLAFLWLAIEYRKSLLVVGGTASGKTSTMNAVSLFIPQNAKVVSLEDTREIQLPHKNWLPTQTRELNTEGIKGDIDLFSLLKACMRQRPEYIIVGEVRGREAQTLFQAMNSGHATLSTIHAGSVYEAINRLTHDPINVPPVMFQALDLVVVQSIYTLGKSRIRRCLSIHEIEVTRTGEIVPHLLFEWDVQNDMFRKAYEKSEVLAEIAFHCGWDEQELEHQLKKREEFFTWALEVEPPTLRDLANAIQDLGD